MPLADYDIYDEDDNYLFTMEDEFFRGAPPKVLKVEGQPTWTARRVLPIPAKPSNTAQFGINGKYDRGLGCTYTSWKERDKIASDKGLVPLDALPPNFVEDKLEYQKNKREAFRAYNEIRHEAVQTYGEELAGSKILPDYDIINNTGTFKLISEYIED